MGQEWMLIDLDAQQIIGGQGKLGEWFWSSGYMLESLKVAPSSLKIDTLLKGHVEAQTSALVHRLPLEVFDFVVDNVIGAKDEFEFFSLAVTCKTILSLLRKRILAWQQQHSRSTRVGHRIICIGEYADMFPPGLLTAEELQQLALHPTINGYDIMGYVYARFQSSCNQPPNRDIQSLIAAMQHLQEYGTLSPKWCAADLELMKTVCTPHFPSDGPWVLCNISKREYVCKDVAEQRCAALLAAHPSNWPSDGPTFEHYLLANICWSGDDSTAMPYSGEDLIQGRWAGDRFAYTLMDRLEELGKGPWTDVTDDVSAQIERMWVAQCDCD